MNEDLNTPNTETMIPVDELDAQGLKNLVEAGMLWLKTNQQIVNALNVFPVPDGDTGTNMLLTMQAAYQEIANSQEKNIGRLAHAVAQGALMGARGNSGVILSQLWRGFARVLDNLDTLNPETLVKGLIEAKNTAYKGVVRPVEGTILTVAKDIAAESELALQDQSGLKTILERVVKAAEQSVKNTPELLPVLKQAGVVDSGGKGLFFIFEGMLRRLDNLSLDTPLNQVQPLASMNLAETKETIEPGQDYEIVVDFQPSQNLNLDVFYADLSQMGTSIQVGEGDGMYRMHIHVPTENRYKPIDYTMKLGTITKVSIENLIAQMEQIESNSAPEINCNPVEPGQIAVVAVSPGVGLSKIFASLGVSAIISGGQTMNPSTEEILHAFENLPTDKIIILPNNKNIIMAAQSTQAMTVKNVKVIPSTSIPQGLSAMLRLNPEGDLDTVFQEMTEALAEVETGEITIATRSVEMNGVQVNEGQVIALYNGKLVDSTNSLESACLNLLKKAGTDEKERITFFYGNNVTKNQVKEILETVRSEYPDHEIEVHEGGQPYYQFIISIE